METPALRPVDRRRAATSKLVVVDLSSLITDAVGAIEPTELAARSVIVKTMAEARREGDRYLVGTPVELAWAASELFPGAALVIEQPGTHDDCLLADQFLAQHGSGTFDELVIVSGSARFRDIVDRFQATNRTVRVISMPGECDLVLDGQADVTLLFPTQIAA